MGLCMAVCPFFTFDSAVLSRTFLRLIWVYFWQMNGHGGSKRVPLTEYVAQVKIYSLRDALVYSLVNL